MKSYSLGKRLSKSVFVLINKNKRRFLLQAHEDGSETVCQVKAFIKKEKELITCKMNELKKPTDFIKYSITLPSLALTLMCLSYPFVIYSCVSFFKTKQRVLITVVATRP